MCVIVCDAVTECDFPLAYLLLCQAWDVGRDGSDVIRVDRDLAARCNRSNSLRNFRVYDTKIPKQLDAP